MKQLNLLRLIIGVILINISALNFQVLLHNPDTFQLCMVYFIKVSAFIIGFSYFLTSNTSWTKSIDL